MQPCEVIGVGQDSLLVGTGLILKRTHYFFEMESAK